MFQVIFMLSDWILIKQILVFSTPFVLGEPNFQKILPGVLSGDWGRSRNKYIQFIFYECEHHKSKNISNTWWNKQV